MLIVAVQLRIGIHQNDIHQPAGYNIDYSVALPILTLYYCRVIKLMRLQAFTRAPTPPPVYPVIPSALLEFLRDVDLAHAVNPERTVDSMDAETQTEAMDRFQDLTVSIDSVMDRNDGENGTCLQFA